MTNKSNGYPLFGAQFNEIIDYGFDTQSLITPFLKPQQQLSKHENENWKCIKSYCLYYNKSIESKQKPELKHTDYVQSNTIDIIKTSSSDFICHTTGKYQNVLRVCKWNENNKLKHG
eukprot:41130_1